jgi:ferrochelatase
MAMGGPDSLENVEAYLKDVRGGRPMTPEFVDDIKERYRQTGGKSPALDILRDAARKLEQKLNGPGGERFRVYAGLRHWRPSIKDAYADLMDELPERLVCVCMAPQYSSLSVGAYMKKVDEARAQLGGEFPVSAVESWNRHPALIAAIADNIQAALQKFPPDARSGLPVVFTAHSLPERIVEAKDPYPEQVQGTMAAVCERLGRIDARFAYQSQGQSGERWLGPTVESVLEELAREGRRHVLIAPIGFLSDHLEVLYDVDIHFKRVAAERGMQLERIAMLNATAPLIDLLASIVDAHLEAFAVKRDA